MYASAAQAVASTLETLLDEKTHSLQCRTGLIYQVDDTKCRITICKKIINEEYSVPLFEIIFADAYRVGFVFGKLEYLCYQHILHCTWHIFLGKENRYI